MLHFKASLVVPIFESMKAMWAIRNRLLYVIFVEDFHVLVNKEVEQTFFAHAIHFTSATTLLNTQNSKVHFSLSKTRNKAFGYVLNPRIIG
jgi:hypothetical protein